MPSLPTADTWPQGDIGTNAAIAPFRPPPAAAAAAAAATATLEQQCSNISSVRRKAMTPLVPSTYAPGREQSVTAGMQKHAPPNRPNTRAVEWSRRLAQMWQLPERGQ